MTRETILLQHTIEALAYLAHQPEQTIDLRAKLRDVAKYLDTAAAASKLAGANQD